MKTSRISSRLFSLAEGHLNESLKKFCGMVNEISSSSLINILKLEIQFNDDLKKVSLYPDIDYKLKNI